MTGVQTCALPIYIDILEANFFLALATSKNTGVDFAATRKAVFILISCFIDREAQISTEGLPTLSGLMLYHKSRCFVQSQQNIHILYCGTRGAFPQVVKDGDQQDSLIVARYRDLHIIPT